MSHAMERLACKDPRRTLWFGRSQPPYDFTCPLERGEYALLLVVGDATISPEDQHRLSQQFVRSGCRYAVCFGPTSSSWDDSIDMVSVLDEVEGRPGPFVMTTWHDHEPLEDAVEFFEQHTSFDDLGKRWIPSQFVVLVVGGDAHLEARVRRAVCGRFGAATP